jgi:hypothetical protein
MTDKDILRMAHDAELTDSDLGEWMVDYGYSKDQIKKFAELVAAAEREACAQVCDYYATALDYGGSPYTHSRECKQAAAAIRARATP